MDFLFVLGMFMRDRGIRPFTDQEVFKRARVRSGRVGSGQELLKYHGSDRVWSEGDWNIKC